MFLDAQQAVLSVNGKQKPPRKIQNVLIDVLSLQSSLNSQDVL